MSSDEIVAVIEAADRYGDTRMLALARRALTKRQEAGTAVNSVTVPDVIDPPHVRALQRAGQRATEAVEARNTAIVAAHQAGATLREIGDAVGLTHVAVMKIIKRTR